MTTTARVPAIEGWFTLDDAAPRLLGLKCGECGTVVFPPRALACPNPACPATDLASVELSRTGTVWSYTVNHYAPPEPYMSPDPFVPYAVAAVELADEQIVVLGQVAGDPSTLAVGAPVEVVLDTLFEDGEGEHVVWKWKVVAGEAGA
ncbi:MAG TPA: Zn-ribbon domain-containing OB-fold protein [Acidimicrobiia bacterium]|nr:Zn-ribbon domain-containing OB-fold protein [Acidimicrobiia bacterium]